MILPTGAMKTAKLDPVAERLEKRREKKDVGEDMVHSPTPGVPEETAWNMKCWN